MKKFHYDGNSGLDREEQEALYSDAADRYADEKAFEQYEATIQSAYEKNSDRPDLFVEQLQSDIKMSDEAVMKEVFDRYDKQILTKYFFLIKKGSAA